ncbi:acyl-CoA/acyl-ACP dehydrogenase [Acidovorax sp. GBBC 3334]|uniref:acyl-CoA dehydrogenase family protein n=1 Tax=Acidovorax sp. GBBC 3334 TaxID=2940496 RepID=UPI002304AF96|nr:acyl-CoA dehydrogenase family protein [Acidovorax sp. GBBC 3334]MDA8455708.1 acyl-CoA/acyl-ACP dehydrogenase [Acidovorax sp. GBBC 3334]
MNARDGSCGAVSLAGLRAVLQEDVGAAAPAARLRRLIDLGCGELPLPALGRTAERWRALAEVAAHDLSLAKLYEGHTDALAILCELRAPDGIAGSTRTSVWGTWAAEAPGQRVAIRPGADGGLRLHGQKAWCSGAEQASHGLLTAWHSGADVPQLVAVEMGHPGMRVDGEAWQAVGMAASASATVSFDGVPAAAVGEPGDYLHRPGFWQGGAGVAACWHGGATALGRALHAAVLRAPAEQRTPFRLAALGRVDLCLAGTAALLRDAAQWIDTHPQADARWVALRVRQAAEACAQTVLEEVGRALGATPFCRDAAFARMAADLPVFIRQSHAARDDAALGECLAGLEEPPWTI